MDKQRVCVCVSSGDHHHGVVKEELLGCSSFGYTYKARFKAENVAIKELITNKWNGTRRKKRRKVPVFLM